MEPTPTAKVKTSSKDNLIPIILFFTVISFAINCFFIYKYWEFSEKLKELSDGFSATFENSFEDSEDSVVNEPAADTTQYYNNCLDCPQD